MIWTRKRKKLYEECWNNRKEWKNEGMTAAAVDDNPLYRQPNFPVH